MDELRFAWWNVQDFGHYTPERAGQPRWPASTEAYAAKCTRVDSAVERLKTSHGIPHVFGFAEITKIAAEGLRDRLFPNYSVHSMDMEEPTFQVAILFDPKLQHELRPPFIVPDMPRGTRPIAILDVIVGKHRLRFFANHWTSRFDEHSKIRREQIAAWLNHKIYDFMRPKVQPESPHVVVFGDLNEEPYGIVEEYLEGNRSRDRARARATYHDDDARRIRLYNCSWRTLGERVPHARSDDEAKIHSAGTYYWRAKSSWHTFDHILVSGTLLSRQAPLLDESSVRIVCDKEFVHPDGKPDKFAWNALSGVSDHLPLIGRILL